MRQITGHEGSALNNAVRITADERDESGRCHHYIVDIVGGAPDSGGQAFDMPPFQKGPLLEAGLNGISDEVLIAIVIDRLEGFNGGPYRCRENSLALTKLEEALHWLKHRTAARQKRGVEGTHTI
jgi:hypothetical protein